MAFLTLFRVATGDNWNGIMKVTFIIVVVVVAVITSIINWLMFLTLSPLTYNHLTRLFALTVTR